MALVFLPTQLQALAGGLTQVEIDGVTLRDVIDELLRRHPALRPVVIDEQGELRSHMAIAVDGEIAAAGLREQLAGQPEIHFVMAIRGGM